MTLKTSNSRALPQTPFIRIHAHIRARQMMLHSSQYMAARGMSAGNANPEATPGERLYKHAIS
jgi:hypothetical protein